MNGVPAHHGKLPNRTELTPSQKSLPLKGADFDTQASCRRSRKDRLTNLHGSTTAL